MNPPANTPGDFSAGMYNGAVVVQGQFGATSYVDFLVQVRNPPKHCSNCFGDNGTCAISSICESNDDCDNLCGSSTGICTETAAPYIYYIRDQNSPASSCTSDSHSSSDCIVRTFEYNTCGDIVFDVHATGDVKLGGIEAFGDLADYFTVDSSTLNSTDVRGTLNFTDAVPEDAGKTYRMCFKAVTCGPDTQSSYVYVFRVFFFNSSVNTTTTTTTTFYFVPNDRYGGVPTCVDVTFEDTQLSMSVSAPGDLDACADVDVLYIDTAVRSGMVNNAKFEVCDTTDDTCTEIVSDLSTSTACNAETGFCSLPWTLDSSLTTTSDVYLKATSTSMPTCYTPAESSTFRITKPQLPVQVVAPNSEGCGAGLTEWHAGCTCVDSQKKKKTVYM